MQVSNNAKVSDLEERLVLVLVNNHDRARGLHARGVLNRTGNTQADVKVWRDRHARLPNLYGRDIPAFIHGNTRSTHGGGQHIGERFNDPCEFIAYSTASSHDGLRGSQFRTSGFFGWSKAHDLHIALRCRWQWHRHYLRLSRCFYGIDRA